MKKFLPKHHVTHRESLWRFVALIAILALYFAYVSWKFDAATGAWLSVLSWSFFVLCTPVADGGFIIAFPIRLLFGIRMFVTQITVWIIAVLINIGGLYFVPQSYADTVLTRLLETILTNPWPYWSILLISLAGTLLSIWFGDEMIDKTKHTDRKKHHKHGFKHKVILVAGLGVFTIMFYYQILSDLHVTIPGS